MIYVENPAPGSFEHRSGECSFHGDNVVFARPKGSVQRHECVACLLEVAAVVAAQQEKSE